MKRSERHHLKTNQVVELVLRARGFYEQHHGALALGAGLLAVVIVGLVGYAVWRDRQNDSAGALLARGMVVLEAPVVPPADPADPAQPASVTPPPEGSYPDEKTKLEAALPKFAETIDRYPGTSAALTARYQMAAILATLGRLDEARQRYQEVVGQGGGLLAETARLGLADVETRAGRHDEAIRIWKELVASTGSELPPDGLLMQLARAHRAAGQIADARAALQRVVDEFPDSPYAEVARQELDTLQPAPTS
jgi:TolA-binding protein